MGLVVSLVYALWAVWLLQIRYRDLSLRTKIVIVLIAHGCGLVLAAVLAASGAAVAAYYEVELDSMRFKPVSVMTVGSFSAALVAFFSFVLGNGLLARREREMRILRRTKTGRVRY